MFFEEIGPINEPFSLFDKWMQEAQQNSAIQQATAMCVATVSTDNHPHVRTVLCKEWGPKGFVFYTNYLSKKGRELATNSSLAAVFYWDAMFRQVIIEGEVQKTSRQESEAYWQSRPRESQLSQFISLQSEKVAAGISLGKLWSDADLQFREGDKLKEIPCPRHWGGFRVEPKSMEFWIGRKGRLHDRYLFEKSTADWTMARLYP